MRFDTWLVLIVRLVAMRAVQPRFMLRALDGGLKNHNIVTRTHLKPELPPHHGPQWSIATGHRQLDPKCD